MKNKKYKNDLRAKLTSPQAMRLTVKLEIGHCAQHLEVLLNIVVEILVYYKQSTSYESS